MIRLRWVAICLMAGAVTCGSALAQIVPDDWTGNATNHFSDTASWALGAVPGPSNIMAFSPQFSTGPSGNQVMMDVAGSVSGIDVESFSSISANISIIGAGTLTLGASGITMNQTDMSNVSVAFIAVPLALSASQTWSLTSSQLTLMGPVNGAGFALTWNVGSSNLTDTAAGAISGAGTSLTITNPGGLINVAINTGASTYDSGTTITGGAGTVVVVGASSTGPGGAPTKGPFGTGTVTLGNFIDLTTANNSTVETIANNFVIGTGGGPQTVTIQANQTGGLILTGTITDNGAFPGTIDITGPNIGTVDFAGSNSYSGGTNIAFATVTIGMDLGLGFGPVTAHNSTLNFTSNFPSLFGALFANSTIANFSGGDPSLQNVTISVGSTVNFTQGGAEPFVDNLTMVQSVINFAADSVISLNNMTSDAPGSTNSINLNTNSVLGFSEIGKVKYYGTFTGPGSSITYESDGSGTIDLYGANTYSGGSTIFSGAVVVADNNSAFGPGAINVNGGALGVAAGFTVTNQVALNSGTVGGYGTIAPAMADALFVQGGCAVVGGKGTLSSAAGVAVPGILTFGPNAAITLGTNGTMQFSIMNASAAGIGVAGTDYSTINAPANTVTVAASPIAPFTIQLVSVNPATGQTGVANFDPTQTYQWTLLSAGTLNGFAANAFVVDSTTDFQNPLAGGVFSVAQLGNNLVLDFTPVPEPSTWALMSTGLCALGAAVRRRRR
jgi:hypothetical protein